MDLLGYPRHWEARGEPKEHGKRLLVKAVSLDHPLKCPHCEWFAVFLERNGSTVRTLKDSPIRGQHVTIKMKVRRYLCAHCGRSSQQPVSGVQGGSNITDRLIRYIGEEALLKPFLEMAQLVNLSVRAVRDMFNAYTEQLEEAVLPEMPRVIGADGVYIGGVERFIMTDLDRRLIANLLPTIKERALCQLLLQLPGRHRVKTIVIDMSQSFYRVLREVFPDAIIIIDRFHIHRYANDAVDVVRRFVRKDIVRVQGKRTMINRKLLRKHLDQLSEAERADLNWWLELYPELHEAYYLKEAFYEIWYSSCPETAQERYEAWLKRLPGLSERVRKAFGDLPGTVERWREPIFNYFRERYDNGFTERMNRDIKELQSDGRGYKFETIRAKAIFGQMLKRQREEQQHNGNDEYTLLPPVDVVKATETLKQARTQARPKSTRKSQLPKDAS